MISTYFYGMRKRAVETDKKKTYQRTDRVTVMGLVCGKMAERVALARQEEEDRRVRQEACIIAQDDEDMLDDDGFQDDREIWEITHVREELRKNWKLMRVRVWIS